MNKVFALLIVVATQTVASAEDPACTLLPASSHQEDGSQCLQPIGVGIGIHWSEVTEQTSWCGMLLTDQRRSTFTSFYDPFYPLQIAGEYQLQLKKRLGVLASGIEPSLARDGLQMHIDVHPIRGGLGARLAFSLY